jgi:hypothetical protein
MPPNSMAKASARNCITSFRLARDFTYQASMHEILNCGAESSSRKHWQLESPERLSGIRIQVMVGFGDYTHERKCHSKGAPWRSQPGMARHFIYSPSNPYNPDPYIIINDTSVSTSGWSSRRGIITFENPQSFDLEFLGLNLLNRPKKRNAI